MPRPELGWDLMTACSQHRRFLTYRLDTFPRGIEHIEDLRDLITALFAI